MSYGAVRFLYDNLITSVDMITADTQAGGAVQLMELVSGTGSAIPIAVGAYSGDEDRTLYLEIDNITAGVSVGQATYKWRWNDSSSWEATGVTTSATLTTLAYNVQVAWRSHPTEDDFGLGDKFILRVRADYGTQQLIDGDPNTLFKSTAIDHLVFNLGLAQQVTAFAMTNHNWVAGQTTCNLEANSSDAWGAPPYQQALTIASPAIIEYLNQTYRYWRLDPTDGSLSYMTIGELFLGPYLELTDKAVFGTIEGFEYTGYGAESEWGVYQQQAHAQRRTYSIKYERLLPADITSLHAMQTALWDSSTGRVKPCFVHLISDDEGDTLIFAHWRNWSTFRQVHQYLMPEIPDLIFQECPVTSV